jgi:hypothetical protein
MVWPLRSGRFSGVALGARVAVWVGSGVLDAVRVASIKFVMMLG